MSCSRGRQLRARVLADTCAGLPQVRRQQRGEAQAPRGGPAGARPSFLAMAPGWACHLWQAALRFLHLIWRAAYSHASPTASACAVPFLPCPRVCALAAAGAPQRAVPPRVRRRGLGLPPGHALPALLGARGRRRRGGRPHAPPAQGVCRHVQLDALAPPGHQDAAGAFACQSPCSGPPSTCAYLPGGGARAATPALAQRQAACENLFGTHCVCAHRTPTWCCPPTRTGSSPCRWPRARAPRRTAWRWCTWPTCGGGAAPSRRTRSASGGFTGGRGGGPRTS